MPKVKNHVCFYDGMLSGVKFDRGDKKGEKTLKKVNVQPLFVFYVGVVVILKRGCW